MEKLFDIMIEHFPEDKDYDRLYRETYASKPDIQLHNMEKRHQMQLRKMDKLHAREIDEFYAEYSSKKLYPDNSTLEKGYAQFSERVKLINNGLNSRSRSIIIIDDNDANEDITNINNSATSNATMHDKLLGGNDDNNFFVDETYKIIQNEYSTMRKAHFFLFDSLSYSHANERNIILKRSNKTDLKFKQITNIQEDPNVLPQQDNLNKTVILNETKLMDINKKTDVGVSNGQFQLCGKSNDNTNVKISENNINNNSNKNNTSSMESVLYTNNIYHEHNNREIVSTCNNNNYNNVSHQLQTNETLYVNDTVPLKQQMLASVIVDYLDSSKSSSLSWSNDLLQNINSSNHINDSNNFNNINLPMTWAQLIPLMNRVDTSGLETYYHQSKDPRLSRNQN